MTELTIGGLATGLPADCIIVGIAAERGQVVVATVSEELAAALGTGLQQTLNSLGATGADGEAIRIAAPAALGAGFVVAVGLGAAAVDGTYDVGVLRRAAGLGLRSVPGAKKVALALPVPNGEAAAAIAEGALLGAYAFTAFRTADAGDGPVREVGIVADRSQVPDAEGVLHRSRVIGEEVNRCRDLVNTPANVLYPESFAAAVRAAGNAYGVEVDELDELALAEHSFGGILGVGQGSAHPPRLIRIAHTHPEATASLAYVGKGITYDSGGISLKPVGSNEIMKRDMSGAAAVFAAVLTASRLGLKVNVTGWLPLAENMPSGSALRPGDVLRMYGGRTVEVLNTDAEGRLVLADALVRAAEDAPDVIVDVATLTAAMRFGLGNYIFGVMSDDETLRSRIVDAADRAGEQAWPMPLPTELRKSLTSRVADIANTGERMGGGLVAGLFLREFVPESTRWAHLDIAGPAFNEGEPHGYTPSGATGAAVRTLVRLAEEAAAEGLARP